MSCGDNSFTTGPLSVWSERTTNTWLFFPFSVPINNPAIERVRASFEMQNNSGNAKIRPALRMSNNGLAWDTPVAIGTDTSTANGVTYGDSLEDMGATTAGKGFVQFGIQCQNASGALLELCQATLKLDIRGGG